ncbi:hypothetical protein SRB5_52170 [Streptomyces sp. RB5]|uniref:Metalloprotease n=1 Tax=Streptomyces smaragdinus TaxID=2585196 RepID=A0A7K0CNI0_9ACTN|nr:hypothetical protein [Streptomyces smaragdinus]MQY15040.1 hypothetical protein [Streptomyces smaragdinus]
MKRPLTFLSALTVCAMTALGLSAAPAQAADSAPDAAVIQSSVAAAKAGDLAGIDPSLLRSDDPRTQEAIDTLIAHYKPHTAAADKLAGTIGTEWTELRDAAAESAIDGNDYVCTNTALGAYSDQLLEGLTLTQYLVILLYGVLDIPSYDALVFGDRDAAYSYGTAGQYSNEITHTFRDLRNFWDIESGDIDLMAMKNDTMKDPYKVGRTVAWMQGDTYTDEEYLPVAVAIMALMEPLPQGLDNPIYTFNAFAFTAEGDPDPMIQGIGDALVMGDGILTGMQAVGLDEYAPRAIMSHEFGHHVQFETGVYEDTDLTGPEATRRTELMADAFGTYFLVHARGEALNAERYLGSSQSFYEVGDCSFTSAGHHGTPNQRIAASTWGGDLAADARAQGHILPAVTFGDLFEAQLPALVAPDVS